MSPAGATVQDAELGISVRLVEMNARHKRERVAIYSGWDNIMIGSAMLIALAAILFVWAA